MCARTIERGIADNYDRPKETTKTTINVLEASVSNEECLRLLVETEISVFCLYRHGSLMIDASLVHE